MFKLNKPIDTKRAVISWGVSLEWDETKNTRGLGNELKS